MKYVSLASLFLITLILLTSSASAQTLQNGQMQIHLDEVTPTPTPIPTIQPETPKPNVVEQGNSLSFSTNSDIIDYGSFSPTNPILRTDTLTAQSLYPFGFQVLGFEDHPLTSSTSATLPDTSCDNGLCKETNAAEWSNTLTYGFGYTCTLCDGFSNSDEFKQLADTSNDEFAQTLFEGTKEKASQVIFKINIAGSQDLSVPYENTLTFITLPKL